MASDQRNQPDEKRLVDGCCTLSVKEPPGFVKRNDSPKV